MEEINLLFSPFVVLIVVRLALKSVNCSLFYLLVFNLSFTHPFWSTGPLMFAERLPETLNLENILALN